MEYHVARLICIAAENGYNISHIYKYNSQSFYYGKIHIFLDDPYHSNHNKQKAMPHETVRKITQAIFNYKSNRTDVMLFKQKCPEKCCAF